MTTKDIVKPTAHMAATMIENQKTMGFSILVVWTPSDDLPSISFPVLKPTHIIFAKYHVPHANMRSSRTRRASLGNLTLRLSVEKPLQA